MQASLILAAGGQGTRFLKGVRRFLPQRGQTLFGKKRLTPLGSKLFFPLAGRPVLVHSLAVFQKIPQIKETIIALPSLPPFSKVQKLIRGWGFKNVRLVAGGKTRAQSVWNALQKTGRATDWVLVHDGARPLVRKDWIQGLFRQAKRNDGAILAKKVVPTIKEAGPGGRIHRTLHRDKLFEAETPQLVRKSLLKKAYRENPKALHATDESSLLESLGSKIRLVGHNGWNPKITTAEDLELAEAYLGRKAKRGLTPDLGVRPLRVLYTIRTGLGRDTHRLVPGRKFMLGGVRIPFDKGPLGHSDGDALLHAISDAILGAMAAGDIGDWFSDKNSKYKNIPSSKILAAVLKKAEKMGFRPEQVDTVTVLERPRLGAFKQKIRKKIAKLLGLPETGVSIKAKTAEGLGPEGQGLAVTSEALVTLQYISSPACGGGLRRGYE